MTAKLMSGSVCFEPIPKSALYQGTTSVVPKRASRTRASAPESLLPSQFGFGQRSAAQPASRTSPLQHSIEPIVLFPYVRAEARILQKDEFAAACLAGELTYDVFAARLNRLQKNSLV